MDLRSKEIIINENSFVVKGSSMIMKVSEWGRDTVRVTCYPDHKGYDSQQGMEELEKNGVAETVISKEQNLLTLTNNRLKVVYDGEKLIFFNEGIKILEEYSRQQSKVRRTIGIDEHIPILDNPTSSLNVSPQNFLYKGPHTYRAKQIFEGIKNEKIFGMGGYQEENLNKNGNVYEMMQRNSQTTIPFYLSDKNYGFIWNNSSIGSVAFGNNKRVWTSENTDVIDYLVTVGKNPKEITKNYTEMTGRSPVINTEVLGLWQSKLRYQTLEEIKEIYEQYKKRNIILSVLVIDYYHWTADGDFEFDKRYWQGIEDFAKELKEAGTQLMVSLWPTVTPESKYFDYYKDNQLCIRGVQNKDDLFAGKMLLDFFHPETKKHLKKVLDKNYRDQGINLFWADQAEPEMDYYHHNDYLVYDGRLDRYANKYPYHYLKGISNHADTQPTLIRSAWFNSQKYGSLAWSGDIESSFESLKRQIQVGISMGISGITWWTSDIAGFHSGNSNSESFKELMVRWFQFATFSPILRMHGDRQPHKQRIGSSGGGVRTSGGPNEIWSFGEKVESILGRFTRIREKLKPYIETLYTESAQMGTPVMRSLFFEYPDDDYAWNDTTNFMFGGDLLVAPVVNEAAKEMTIYLPKGENWINVFTQEVFAGGNMINVSVSLENIPVFCKKGSTLEPSIEKIFIDKKENE